VRDLVFDQESCLPSEISSSKATALLGVKSYNGRLEEWEPLMEDFSLDFEQIGEKQVSETAITTTDLDINFSVDVAKCISTFMTSWAKA
jgi:hypothetical protein